MGAIVNTLIDLYPYVMGKSHFAEVKVRARLDQDYLKLFVNMLSEDQVAQKYFEVLMVHEDFYNTLVDFNHFIPPEQQAEVFYAAKLGRGYREIPSFCAYILDLAWKQCNGIPNLIPKVLSGTHLRKFCGEGYLLGGLSLHDAICNVCTDQYMPFNSVNTKNLIKAKTTDELDFYEIYIRESDMVAAVPKSIGDVLTDSTISKISVTPNGLFVGGQYIRTMANHLGVINSIYDLREVI